MVTRWMKLSSTIAISYGQTNSIIAAGILIASVVAYVIPTYGSGKFDKSKISKGKTIDTGCRDPGACIPSANSCIAVLFVGLHACGLLSNSYISKLLNVTRFVVKAIFSCLVLNINYMPCMECCEFAALRRLYSIFRWSL